MQYYALCIRSCFVMYQKVYLLLDDITVVATKGDERCLGVHKCIELSFAFQNYMHNSYLRQKNLHKYQGNCIVLMEKQTWV